LNDAIFRREILTKAGREIADLMKSREQILVARIAGVGAAGGRSTAPKLSGLANFFGVAAALELK
jgi:hypothetical protein